MGIRDTRLFKIYRNIMRIDEVIFNQHQIIERLDYLKDKYENDISKINKELDVIKRISREVEYAEIYHDSIKNTIYEDLDLSLSSGAIGYPYAYIMFRILNEIKPKKILETGLGQSSKMITLYANNDNKVRYDVVEHDKNWIEFFKHNHDTSKFQHFHLLPNYKRKYNGCEVNAYKGFKKEFEGKKFDFISIDGPVGVGLEYSRIDILDIIPDCLEKQFVILIDDCERIGEQRTIELLVEKIEKAGIECSYGYQYWGTTNVFICTSADLEFLCHI